MTDEAPPAGEGLQGETAGVPLETRSALRDDVGWQVWGGQKETKA